jgi:hypothetical protein
MKTLAIELWAGQVRGIGSNQSTRVAHVQFARPRLDVRSYFLHAYSRFADACRGVDEPGLALIAIDEITATPVGMACVRARVDRHVCAIIGRHDRCDLYLAGSDQLALRQLAVIVSPVRDWRVGNADVSFRILDLRTAAGMIDEHSRYLRGLRSEGPTFVRSGGYLLLALPLGDPTDWPASADDAWACLPERVYFDEQPDRVRGSVVVVPPMRDPNMTPIVRLAGPSEIGMLALHPDDVAGRLEICGPTGKGAINVGYQALDDGVLLGRYARCDGAGLATDESMSRVHLLLAHFDDWLLAIDTASTNGTRFPNGADKRVVELSANAELELGNNTRVRWQPLS